MPQESQSETGRAECVGSTEMVAEEAARRRRICTSLAYKASNYYDNLYLRTGNTARDNITELATIFEAEWISKHGHTAARSATVEALRRGEEKP